MNLEIEVQQKPKSMFKEERKVLDTTDVVNLKEVQIIRNAIQEHFIYIGLDNSNTILNMTVLGIGKNDCVNVDVKDIIRLTLMSASSKVILVHNYPSNNMKPSKLDRQLTYTVKETLRAFNIQLLDHVIVSEKGFVSMLKEAVLNEEYEERLIKSLDKYMLIQENIKLKNKIEILENDLQRYEEAESEEEFE